MSKRKTQIAIMAVVLATGAITALTVLYPDWYMEVLVALFCDYNALSPSC